MICALIGLVLFSPLQEPLNWNGPASRVLSGKRNGHTYTVRFEHANFRASGRDIRWIKSKYEVWYPGVRDSSGLRRFFGMDGYGDEEIKTLSAVRAVARDTQLISLSVTVDGKVWPIQPRLYDDLLNPNLRGDHLTGKLAPDGNTLTVTMSGSDGGGSYKATWTFRRHGKHSRLALQSC